MKNSENLKEKNESNNKITEIASTPKKSDYTNPLDILLNDEAWKLVPLSEKILGNPVAGNKSSSSDNVKEIIETSSDDEMDTEEDEKITEEQKKNKRTISVAAKPNKKAKIQYVSSEVIIYTMKDKAEEHIIVDFLKEKKASDFQKKMNEFFLVDVVIHVKNYAIIYKNHFEKISKNCSVQAKSLIEKYFQKEKVFMSEQQVTRFKKSAADHIGHSWGKQKEKIKEGDKKYQIEFLFRKDYEFAGYRLDTLESVLTILVNSNWYVGESYTIRDKKTKLNKKYTPYFAKILHFEQFKQCKSYLGGHTPLAIKLGNSGLILIYNYQELPEEFNKLKVHLDSIAVTLPRIEESVVKNDFYMSLTPAITGLNKPNSHVDKGAKAAFIAIFEKLMNRMPAVKSKKPLFPFTSLNYTNTFPEQVAVKYSMPPVQAVESAAPKNKKLKYSFKSFTPSDLAQKYKTPSSQDKDNAKKTDKIEEEVGTSLKL